MRSAASASTMMTVLGDGALRSLPPPPPPPLLLACAAGGAADGVRAFADAGRAVKAGIDVDLARLPSKCELFYISADLPHGKYSTTKAKEILGWEAQDTLEAYFLRPDAKL